MRVLPHVFLFIVFLLLAFNAVYAWRLPVWHPRNELAHYDYIDALSRGRFPVPGDMIGDYTLDITLRHFAWRRPPSFDGSRLSMGIEGLSYESQQPPAYYLVLAVPNALLRWGGAAPPLQIGILRCVQSTLVALGVLLAIPIAHSLHRSVGLPCLVGYLLACWMALANGVRYASLGNDSLSLLTCNLALLACALWLEKPSLSSRGVWAGGATALALLTKYTNALLLPVLVGVWIAILVRAQRRPRWQDALAFAVPAAAMAGYLAANALLCGDPLRTCATQEVFRPLMTGIHDPSRLLRALLTDAFSLTQFRWLAPPWVLHLAGGSLATAALLAVFRLARGKERPRSALVLGCVTMVAGILAAACALDAFRPGVRWEGFRHYAGVQLLWWWAFFALPVEGLGSLLGLAGRVGRRDRTRQP